MQAWDDVRVFLAAARGGSLAAAAAQLSVDPATIGRRIARLETALKATLFTRSPAGLGLTAAGARLLEVAREAETAIAAAAQIGETDVVGGTVRLSCSEGFGTALVAPELPNLYAKRPQLRIELAANAGFLSASKREADIAVTLSAPPASRLLVEPLTDYELGLFASPKHVLDHGQPKDVSALKRRMLIGYVEDLIYAPELRYMDEISPGLRPALSSSSVRAQEAMIRADGGIGVLPLFLAKGLVRVLPHIKLLRRFWLCTHMDVADTARVRSVRAWLRDLAERRRADLVSGVPYQ